MPTRPAIRTIAFRGTLEYFAHVERLREASGAPTTSALIADALARYSLKKGLGMPPRRADPPGGDRCSERARRARTDQDS